MFTKNEYKQLFEELAQASFDLTATHLSQIAALESKLKEMKNHQTALTEAVFSNEKKIIELQTEVAIRDQLLTHWLEADSIEAMYLIEQKTIDTLDNKKPQQLILKEIDGWILVKDGKAPDIAFGLEYEYATREDGVRATDVPVVVLDWTNIVAYRFKIEKGDKVVSWTDTPYNPIISDYTENMNRKGLLPFQQWFHEYIVN
jgi:hypothetical protein